jgi:hypothetical protein
MATQFIKTSAKALLDQVTNEGFREYDWKNSGGLRRLLGADKVAAITPYLERAPWEVTLNASDSTLKTVAGGVALGNPLAVAGIATAGALGLLPAQVNAGLNWPVKSQLDYLMLSELVGADPKSKDSGERLYTDFMKNMLTRKPAQNAAAPTQASTRSPTAPTDLDTYIDFGKSSTLGALSAAAALDAQNDKAVSYRHMEGTVKRLAKSVPEQYSVKVEEMAREQLAKTPKMSSKALYDHYEKNILGNGETPGTLRHTILQQEIEKAKALKAVKDAGESGLAGPPPEVPK